MTLVRSLVFLAFLALGARAQDSVQPPRLCVVVLVDQLIPEQLERLEPWLEGGLGRLWREGRVFRRASLAHGVSFTAPGHVSAATGVYPSRHGVVANAWYDRSSRKGVYCCEDDSARLVTNDGVQPEAKVYRRSPALCEVPGIATHVKSAGQGGRALSICGKDRAAIALAGRGGDLALWWDWRTGSGFAGSSFYTDELPEWVRTWNESWSAQASGFVWEPVTKGELEGSGTAVDDRDGEFQAHGWTRSMPHEFPRLTEESPPKQVSRLARLVYESALADEFTAQLAIEALRSGEFGTDDSLDLLALAFASTDTTGHLFGPYSREVTDVVVRLDRLLGEILRELDERVGDGRWVLALTSDHGVLELPESLRARDVDARRVPLSELEADRNALSQHLEREFGESLVLRQQAEGIYLNHQLMREKGIDAGRVRASTRDFLAAKADWVHAGHTLDEIQDALRDGTDNALLRLASRSYFEGRSPDVFVQQKPGYLLAEAAGTTHGTPYDYDRDIPLLFYGPGFAAGHRFEPATSCDLVPTLLDALGVAVDFEFDGRVLSRE